MKTGFLRVDIPNNMLNEKRFCVRYSYVKDGRNVTITRTKLEELKEEVLKRNLPWKITDKKRALIVEDFNRTIQYFNDISVKEKKELLNLLIENYKKNKKQIKHDYNIQKQDIKVEQKKIKHDYNIQKQNIEAEKEKIKQDYNIQKQNLQIKMAKLKQDLYEKNNDNENNFNEDKKKINQTLVKDKNDIFQQFISNLND